MCGNSRFNHDCSPEESISGAMSHQAVCFFDTAFVITGLWVINFSTSMINLSSSTFLHTGVTTKNVTLKSKDNKKLQGVGVAMGDGKNKWSEGSRRGAAGLETGAAVARWCLLHYTHTSTEVCEAFRSADWFY